MAKYTQALALRSSLMNQMTEILDLSAIVENDTQFRELFKRRFQRAINIFERFQTNHDIVVATVANQTNQNQLAAEENIRKEFYANFDEIERVYCKLFPADNNQNNHTPQADATISTTVRLPKLTLREFNGEFSTWTAFIQSFNSVIHNNTSLSNVDKFQYLLSCLSKEPLNLVKALTLSDENYDTAYKTLINRYDDKRKLASFYWNKIQSLSRLKSESARGLRDLLDYFRENRAALLTLQIKPSVEDFMWSNLLLDKLDSNTRRLFEEDIRSATEESVLSFENLEKFIEGQCRILDSISSNTATKVQPSPKSFVATHRGSDQIKSNDLYNCPICRSSSHSIYKCNKLLQQTPKQRFALVKQHKLCINCLRKNHILQNCPSDSTCRQCHSKHHTLLHFEMKTNEHQISSATVASSVQTATPNSDQSQQPTVLNSNSNNTPEVNTFHALSSIENKDEQSVLLATALVLIKDSYGIFRQVRCLIDPGSQANYITKHCVQKLGFRYTPAKFSICGIGGNSSLTAYGTFRCSLVSKASKNYAPVPIEAIVLQKICPDMPTSTISRYSEWKHISNLTLADPTFYQSNKIDMLLGAGVFSLILNSGKVEGDLHTPSALNTIFGWILMGSYAPINNSVNVNSFLAIHNQSLDSTLKKFWEVEEPPQLSLKSVEDEWCENHFSSTTCRNQDGRYIVSLPFKAGQPSFKGSREIAERRFFLLEKRLLRDVELYASYKEFLKDYLEQNHMSFVENPVVTQDSYFIPHHCVLRPESTSTKLRVVFDASAKDINGLSLNDTLFAGPKFLNDLITILLNFRRHSIVVTADIRQMYRQILVSSSDQKYQKILFRFNPSEILQEYNLNTVTYGVSCAPYLAIRVIRQLATDEATRFPRASAVLLSDVYVDDVVTGCQSVDDAFILQQQLINLLKSGGFELRKWSSNVPELLENLDSTLRSEGLCFDDNSNSVIKVLGLRWYPSGDYFSYNVQIANRSCTKRTILSEISKIFDPLGFLAPLTLFAKHLIQHLWSLKLDWDEKPPDDVLLKWEQYLQQLPLLSKVTVLRQVTTTSADTVYQLHAFCDASERGYCSVLYLRSENRQSHDVSVKLIMAKSKVAPLKTLSIPRLELCAAYLLSKLVSFVVKTYSSTIHFDKICAWTDSTIVLCWLNSSPHLRKTFVSNRVAYIQEKVLPSCWKHVSSAENPADVGSRGLLPTGLVECDIWWKGPQWLMLSEDQWPGIHSKDITTNNVSEEDKIVTCLATPSQIDDSHFIMRLITDCSSLLRLQNVMAYILRYIKNCKTRTHRKTDVLSQSEIISALLVIIRHVQELVFANEINLLKANKFKSMPRSFRKLNAFLDAQGLVRVGGRLRQANLPYSSKHPLLLPKNHRLTQLIVMHYHQNFLHPGVQTLSSILRQSFWIFSSKQAIRKYTSACHNCFRAKPLAFQPFMADLPACRVNQLKPFQCVGIDFGGPFSVSMGRYRGVRTEKGYICLFVCFTTKAIHLELASKLSTEVFLAALRRFLARRGKCSKIFSDCGTNFVGASRELHVLMKSAAEEEKITWSFNPPSAPHFGGIWEAGIKSVKSLLVRVIGEQILSYEEFSTLLAQIEAVLNSRPLVPSSSDPNDLSALTPGHFLTLAPLSALPESDSDNEKLNLLNRWKLIQRLHREFWRRWHFDYLNTLQQRQKWIHHQQNVKIGQMVLIKNDLVSPLKWHYGRIIDTHAGSDGIIRVVTLKTVSGTLKRPLTKLCPLPELQDS